MFNSSSRVAHRFAIIFLLVAAGCMASCRGEGADCTNTACPEGLACVADDEASPVTYTCQEPLGEGDICARTSECVDGMHCGCAIEEHNGIRCTGERRCRPYSGRGEPCHRYGCEGSLLCNYVTSPPTCTDPVEPGGECAIPPSPSHRQCVAGHECNLSTEPSTCQPAGIEGAFCGGYGCNEGLRCKRIGDIGRCVALREDGEACANDEDCNPGLICRRTEVNCSTCVPERELGDECVADADCEEGLVCLQTSDPAVCALPKEEGQECTRDEECAGLDLLCNQALATPRCQTPGGIGDLCSSDRLCESDLICNEAHEAPRCVTPGELGDTCKEHEDCHQEFRCNASTDPPECASAGRAGQICFRDEECAEGFVCHHGQEHQWVCKPPSQLGEACGWDYDCGGELICTDATCVEPTLEGEPCTEPFECEKAPLVCDEHSPPDCVSPRMVCNQAEDICTMQRAEGGRCASRLDCRPGLVCNTAFEPAECSQPGDRGAPCSADNHCATGLQCGEAGTCVEQTCP